MDQFDFQHDVEKHLGQKDIKNTFGGQSCPGRQEITPKC